ncbi:MAG: energy transducer TonB [Balneola sp.]
MKSQVNNSNLRNYFRNNYFIFFEVGLILALIIHLVLFRISFSPSEKADFILRMTDEIVFLEESIPTKQEIKVPPPQRPVVPIEVPNDEIIEDEIIFMSSELDSYEIIGAPPPPPNYDNEEDVEEEVFVIVEQPPVLIGGLVNLQSKINYPKIAIESGVEGRVVVQFVIDKNGNILNPKIVRGIGAGCDEEALRVIKLARFKPGMQRGKPVSVSYTIPINFRLSKN